MKVFSEVSVVRLHGLFVAVETWIHGVDCMKELKAILVRCSLKLFGTECGMQSIVVSKNNVGSLHGHINP